MSKDTTGNAGSETWRPIESAPRDDETTIFATDGKWYAAVVLNDYSTRKTVIHHWAVCQEYEWNPTHWMPLPDPPTTEKPNE